MREGEIDGKRYFFITPEQFEQAIANDEFIEYAQAQVHHGYYYGTKKKPILEALADGLCPIKEIEVEVGVQTIIKNKTLHTDQYISIFLDVPDEVMTTRILSRQPDIDQWLLASKLWAASIERSLAQSLGLHIIDASQSLDIVQKDLLTKIESLLS
jgi:guanylate kinase